MSADLAKTFREPVAPTDSPSSSARLVIRGEGLDHVRLDATLGVEAPERRADTWSITYEDTSPSRLLTRMLGDLPGSGSPIWTELRAHYKVHFALDVPPDFGLSTLLLSELGRLVPHVSFSLRS